MADMNVNLGAQTIASLLDQYNKLDPNKEPYSCSKIEQGVAQALAAQEQAKLAALRGLLTPAQLEAFKKIGSVDTFQNRLPSVSFLKNFCTTFEVPPSDEAVKLLELQIQQANQKKAKGKDNAGTAANPAQKTLDSTTMPDDGKDKVDSLKQAIKSITNPGLRNKLLRQLEGLRAAVTEQQIVSEGFQIETIKQALAFLSGQPSKLTDKQKAALEKAFPNDELRKGFAEEVKKRFDLSEIEKSEAWQKLPKEEQDKIRAENEGLKGCFDKLLSVKSADDLSAADKDDLAKKISGLNAPASGMETMTDEQIASIKDPGLQQRAKELRDSYANDRRRAEACYDDLMGILNSGMPIEAIIMLFMIKMNDRFEEKMRLKLKEQAFASDIERKGLNENGALPIKSSSMLYNEVQVVMQQYTQMTQMLSSVMRMLQDMLSSILRNVH